MESRGFKGAKRPPARPPFSARRGAGSGPVRGPEPALARPSDQDATAPDSAAGTKLRAAMRTDSSIHYSLARRTARATRPTSPCGGVSPHPYSPRRPEIVDLRRFYGPHLLRNVWTGSGNGLRAPLIRERAPIVATNGNLSRCVTQLLPPCMTSARRSRHGSPGRVAERSTSGTLCEEDGVGGSPAIQVRFPILARSSRVQYNGRKCISCSPVILYTIPCRDSGLPTVH